MIINIAINENFGKLHTPKGFDSEAVGTQWRIDLANYLKEHAVTIPKKQLTVPKEQFAKETIDKNWEKGLITNYENLYYFPSDLNGQPIIAHLTIVDIDTTKPWIITTYDGAESVEAIPEYRQMDDFNYHEMWSKS